MIALSDYEYKELDPQVRTIRLIEIVSGDTESEVRCQVHIQSLDHKPVYTALSYTWGSPPASCPIYLDGQLLAVRKNLWRFLRAMASKHNPGELFWIDAICINQRDNAERTQQVNLMSQIYKMAHRVLVWLGPAYEDSDLAMQAIARDISYWQGSRRISKVLRKPLGTAIRGLCERAYWARLWIYQELMLANEIEFMCGSMQIFGRKFREFLLFVRASSPLQQQNQSSESFHSTEHSTEEDFWEGFPESEPGPQKPLCFEHEHIIEGSALKLIMQLGESLNKPSLWDLMEKTSQLRCSDERDKIYGLLGIAEVGCDQISPDYTTSISNLLNDVLRNVHQIQSPTSIEEIEEQCRQITGMVGTSVQSIFALKGPPRYSEQPKDADIVEHPLGPAGSNITLWWAGFHGHKAVEKLLLKIHIDFQKTLYKLGDHRAVVRRVVEAGAAQRDIRQLGGLLARFSSHGSATVVEMLLENGANVNFEDSGYGYPLYAACGTGDKNIVLLLLHKGANVNAQGGKYGNALQATSASAFARARDLTNIVQLLLSHGVDVNAQGGKYSNALQAASAEKLDKIVQLLLDNGADSNAQGGYYGNALQAALSRGHKSIVRILLASGADINVQGGKYGNALQAASAGGLEELVQLLLDKGHDINTQGGYYGDALQAASARNYKNITKILLDRGASVNAQGGKYGNALQAASSKRCKGSKQILLDMGAHSQYIKNDAERKSGSKSESEGTSDSNSSCTSSDYSDESEESADRSDGDESESEWDTESISESE